MSPSAFRYAMFGIVGVTALSATSFPGAMIGFFFGVAVAFFIAGPSFIAAAALRDAGYPATDKTVLGGLVSLYVLLVIGLALTAWWQWRAERFASARWNCFRAALFASLPLMGWLSIQALAEAWP